jgi:hypothetical protein
MSFEAVALETVALETVALEAMSLEAMSLEAMTASCVLHEFSLLDLAAADESRQRGNHHLCQEGRYAGAINEVTRKGQQETDMS